MAINTETLTSKFVARVLEVFPYDNCVTVESLEIHPKVVKYVPILLNGQPMPSVGDTVIVDATIPQYPFVIGKYPMINPEKSDAIQEKQLSCGEYPRSPVQYGDSTYSNEGDFVVKHRFTNTIIGLIRDIIIAKASQDAFLIFSKLENSLSGVLRNINITTGFGNISIERYDENNVTLKMSGKLYSGTTENNLFIEAGTIGEKILKLEIFSATNDLVYSMSIYRDGNVSVYSGPVVFECPSLAILTEDIALTIKGDVNFSVKDNIRLEVGGNTESNFNGSLDIRCGGSASIGVANNLSATVGTLDLNIIGRRVPLPTSPAATIGVSNGTLDFFVGDPTSGDVPSACSGINFYIGLPRLTRTPGAPYHFAVFSSTPGTIIIGGPPTMLPINGFVKFNEFAVLMSGVVMALSQIAAAFAAATDPVLKAAAPTLTANVGVLTPLIPTTMSLYVRTSEP